jgi:hypothetical protein
MSIDISIILPVYKQVEHAEFLVNEYVTSLKNITDSWEILFIVNGQDDGAYKKLSELTQNTYNIHVHKLDYGGWGKAVKFGIAQAKGNLVCFTNSSRTKVDDLIMILEYAKVNANNVIKANRLTRDTYFRKVGSLLYNLENRILLKTITMDVNATPKVFPAKIIKNMNIISDNDIIDAEILARCFKNNIRVIEIPIIVNDRISGKSTTNIISAMKMFWGLYKISKKIQKS